MGRMVKTAARRTQQGRSEHSDCPMFPLASSIVQYYCYCAVLLQS